MNIFNMSNRDKGELSIFTGDEWLVLDGKCAAYIYGMNDKIENLMTALEAIGGFDCTCPTGDVARAALARVNKK